MSFVKNRNIDMSKMIINICATTGCTEDEARETLTATDYDADEATHKILDQSQKDGDAEFDNGWQTFSRVKKNKKKSDVAGSGDGFQNTKSNYSYNRPASFKKESKYKSAEAPKSTKSSNVPSIKSGWKDDDFGQTTASATNDRKKSMDNCSDEMRWDNAGDLELNKNQVDDNSCGSPGWISSDDFEEDSGTKKSFGESKSNKETVNTDELPFHGPDTQLIGSTHNSINKPNAWKTVTVPVSLSTSVPRSSSVSTSSEVVMAARTPTKSCSKTPPPSDNELLATLLPIFGKLSSTPTPPLSCVTPPDVPVKFTHKHNMSASTVIPKYKFYDETSSNDAEKEGPSNNMTSSTSTTTADTATTVASKQTQHSQIQMINANNATNLNNQTLLPMNDYGRNFVLNIMQKQKEQLENVLTSEPPFTTNSISPHLNLYSFIPGTSRPANTTANVLPDGLSQSYPNQQHIAQLHQAHHHPQFQPISTTMAGFNLPTPQPLNVYNTQPQLISDRMKLPLNPPGVTTMQHASTYPTSYVSSTNTNVPFPTMRK